MKITGYKKYLVSFLGLGIFLFPNYAKADFPIGKCSPEGYSVVTVNGMLTDEKGAKINMRVLKEKLGPSWNNQIIDYQYLLNPSHIAGLLDFVKVIEQKALDFTTVKGYDFIEMLKDAHVKVKTQKLLLVGHSQGNFYVNSFYDTLAGKTSGVPKKSLGVYAVATPASRVAGNGKYLTSSTDKVIATWVSNLSLGTIKKSNIDIEFKEDANGHSFSEIYLKYAGEKIVEDIQYSLDKLSANDIQDEQSNCIAEPDLSIVDAVSQLTKGAVLAVADPVSEGLKKSVQEEAGFVVDFYATTFNVAATGANLAYNATVNVGNNAGMAVYDGYRATADVAVKVKDNIKNNLDVIADGVKNLPADMAGFFKNIFSKKDIQPSELAGDVSSAISSLSEELDKEFEELIVEEVEVSPTFFYAGGPQEIEEARKAAEAAARAEAKKKHEKYLAEFEIIKKKYLEEQTRLILAQRAQQVDAAQFITQTSPQPVAGIVIEKTAPVTAAEEAPAQRAGRAGHQKEWQEEPSGPPPVVMPDLPETQNFEASYDPSRLEINFSWDAPAGTAMQKLKDESTGEFIFETASETSFDYRIYEVNRSYNYSIHSYDLNGIELDSAEAEVAVPGFIKNAAFFHHEHQYHNTYNRNDFVEFYFDSYPFLPVDLVYNPGGAPGTGPNRKAMVLYYNKDAPQHEFLNSSLPQPEDNGAILFSSGVHCFETAEAVYSSIEMPDTADNCAQNGVSRPLDYDYNFGEGDNHLVFPAGHDYRGFFGFMDDFGPADYFTTAFYGFYRNPSDVGVLPEDAQKEYKLLAVDNTRHYFQPEAPAHLPPEPPGNIDFSLDEATMLLTVNFSPATDPDSFDSVLQYEISIDGGATWQDIDSGGPVVVEPEMDYQIQLRASDDFNLKSVPAELEFSSPAVSVPFGLANIRWGHLASPGEAKLEMDYGAYPFIPGGDEYDIAVFFLNRLPPADYSFQAYSGSSNHPFSQLGVGYANCAGDAMSGLGGIYLNKFTASACDNSSASSAQMHGMYPTPAQPTGTISVAVNTLYNHPITASPSILTSGDYITVGFYNISSSGQTTLVGHDTHKYYFAE